MTFNSSRVIVGALLLAFATCANADDCKWMYMYDGDTKDWAGRIDEFVYQMCPSGHVENLFLYDRQFDFYDGVFETVSSISSMYMSSLNSRTIPVQLTSLQLQKLNLYRWYSVSNLEALTHFTTLSSLYITTANLKGFNMEVDGQSVPLDLSALSLLTHLNLYNNDIYDWEGILTIPNLEILNMGSNPLDCATGLDLTHVDLKEFHAGSSQGSADFVVRNMLHMTGLTHMNLYYSDTMEQTHFDLFQSTFTNMEILELEKALSWVNHDFFSTAHNMSRLKLLELDYNAGLCGHHSAAFWGSMPELTRVDLPNTDSSCLNSWEGADVFHANSKMTKINFSYAQFDQFPQGLFDSMTALTYFEFYYALYDGFLHGDMLATMPNLEWQYFGELTGLTGPIAPGFLGKKLPFNSFALYNNGITSIPAGLFDETPMLSYVYMSGLSMLSTIPAGLFDKNPRVREINFENTPIEHYHFRMFDDVYALGEIYLQSDVFVCAPYFPVIYFIDHDFEDDQICTEGPTAYKATPAPTTECWGMKLIVEQDLDEALDQKLILEQDLDEALDQKLIVEQDLDEALDQKLILEQDLDEALDHIAELVQADLDLRAVCEPECRLAQCGTYLPESVGCHCDDVCIEYEDCCGDYLVECPLEPCDWTGTWYKPNGKVGQQEGLMDLVMDVTDNILSGSGSDVLGTFTLVGYVSPRTIEFTKQYTGPATHALEYEGISDDGIEYEGEWMLASGEKNAFVLTAPTHYHCTSKSTCKNACNAQSREGECWCDSQCADLGDCCHGFVYAEDCA